MERLPENSAEVLKMTYFDDLPQAEIAKLLDIPIGTVKSRLHTAKQQFRNEYQED
jgi:RNA polymerase sigma-70 factor (ECF subfamily)